jgi:tRNA modification GTPase
VLELQAHGSPAVLDLLLARVLDLGARLARPGEFTERAFLNGKLDLAQAEAVADLIESTSAAAARGAQRTLAGVLSRRVAALAERIAELRTLLEAAIDFPEEEIDPLSRAHCRAGIEDCAEALDALLRDAWQGQLLHEGLEVVIAGTPNVGKSSLLNALARREAAIVTDVPGTTRDPVRVEIHVDGLPISLVDTAGLRPSVDPLEQIGVERARAAIRTADVVALVVDAREGLGPAEIDVLRDLPPTSRRLIVHNKLDLTDGSPRLLDGEHGPIVQLSALTGAGLELLPRALARVAGHQPGEGLFVARRRHTEALHASRRSLRSSLLHLAGEAWLELVAEDLRAAQHALATITGEVTSEDLLERIFSSFCIGK